MCGIAGLFLRRPGAEDALLARAAAMGAALAHRGPDGAGAWADGEAGVVASDLLPHLPRLQKRLRGEDAGSSLSGDAP